jgi:hypothetical protein
VAAHRGAGDRRARSARRVSDPVASALLYRDALLAYARADAVAQGGGSQEGLDAPALAARLPLVPPDAVEPTGEDTARVRRAVAAGGPLYFDTLGRPELDHVVAAMARAAGAARGRLEVRSLTNLRFTRIGRVAGVVLLALVVGVHVGRAWLRPDIALGKPVTFSSYFGGKPELLVDGDIGTSYGIATTNQDNAWLCVDLLTPHRVSTIQVYNRVDGWFDDSLPVVVELSLDGTRWTPVARRDSTFGAFPPWTVHVDRMLTRYVRARSLGHTAFALSEIAVYER